MLKPKLQSETVAGEGEFTNILLYRVKVLARYRPT